MLRNLGQKKYTLCKISKEYSTEFQELLIGVI
jgi:hypothetical protein